MKRFHIFQLVTGMVFFGTFWLAFPNILMWLEGNDLFLFTREYIFGVLERQQGVAYLIANFAEQFFSKPWLASLIYTLFMLLAAELFFLSMRKMGKDSLSWLAVLPAPATVLFRFPDLAPLLYLVSFALALYVFVVLKNRIVRCIYVLLLPFFAFTIMPWSIAAILFLGFSAIELFANKQKILSAIMLLAVLECFLVPSIWSDTISFIPFEIRPFRGIGEDVTWKCLAVYTVMVIVMAVPYKVNTNKWIGYAVVVASSALYYVLMTTNSLYVFIERLYKISYMADNKDWYGVLSEISYEDYSENKAFLCYALLAENALGTLPQNLMKYQINDPESFLFRHITKSFPANFNRQFYDNIGIYDEAFHQAFEYGVNARENECFRTLRHKTDYALASYDLGTAEKYINLLKRSSAHGAWIASRSARLDSLKSKKRPKVPYRSDTLVGAYPIPSEVFRLYERDKDNRKLLDYVLCSLLLRKEVDKFGIILKNFNLYEGERLPGLYAEATAALAVKDTAARSLGDYDHELEKQYLDFVQRAKKGEDCSQYAGTYWAYLLFRELPKETENPKQ